MKRAGFEFDLLDMDAHPQSPEQTERFLRTHSYDVVAMGCIVTGYKYVKWLSATIKENFPETVVVVGNTVAQSIPKILLSKTDADVAVMGEGDEVIVELLERLQTSRNLEGIQGIWYRHEADFAQNPPRRVIEDLDNIPFPNWDLFDIEVYIQSMTKLRAEPLPPIPHEQIRVMTINTARGCPYNCTFCYHIFRGEKYRWRSAASVIREMQYHHEHYGINNFAFHDELTFFSIEQVASFAEALLAKGLHVYWKAECRSGLFVKDEHVEVVRKLKEAGCLELGFSLESSNLDILGWMNKRVGPDVFSRQVEILTRGGLAAATSIVIGYPNETEETIKATIDCCIANSIYPSTGYLLPQPGSPMYKWALEHGYIKDEEAYLLTMGDRQDLRLNMTQLADEQLEAIVKRELGRCNRELRLGLPEAGLLKTSYIRPTSPDKR
jgi:radical SAM superfamily enzyme YgiQ (UPF0313 family)